MEPTKLTVVQRSIGTLHVGGRERTLQPVLFVDLREGILPVNEPAQYFVTLRESEAIINTLTDLLPLSASMAEFQRYALIGPLIQELTSLYSTLTRMVKRVSSSKEFPEIEKLIHEDSLFKKELSELDATFGYSKGTAMLLRNKVFGHRHPILGSTDASYVEIVEAKYTIETPEFLSSIKKLMALANKSYIPLFSSSIWGAMEESVLSQLYIPSYLNLDAEGLNNQLKAFRALFKFPERADLHSRLIKLEGITINS